MFSLRFAGESLHDVTSTYPLGNGYRWYLPWLMRLNAQDDASPFGPGGINPYAYCAADPVNATDPSGHIPLGARGGRLKLDLSFMHSSAAETQVYRPVFGPPSLEEHQAAITIQRGWREYVDARHHDLDTILKILPSMGDKLTGEDDVLSAMREGRILVQANGQLGKAFTGHSLFRFQNMRHEVLIANADMASVSDAAARFGLTAEAAHAYGDYTAGSRAVITRDLPDTSDFAKMNHLAGKGRLFALNKKYSAYFMGALQAEIEDFKQRPYSYGHHYNCRRFVLNMLGRLDEMAE
jgi:RHS repeat-associated protein